MDAHVSDNAAKPYACSCGGGRCVHAWRAGSELYVSGVAGDADPVYMIGRAVNDVTINGIFGAGGDTLFDMYSLAVCMWCLAIPLAAAGTYYFHWPVVVVYACTCIDEVGKLPWVLHHFRKYKWVKDLTH